MYQRGACNQSRNHGVSILNEVLGRIKLDDVLIRENNAILHDFLNSFVDKMKEVDQLFRLLYKKPYFTGSFYSDLRISKPDEFDIDLILDFPFQVYEFQIEYPEPSYAKYHLLSSRHGYLENKLFEAGFLMPGKVRSWFQSVIDSALASYRPPISCHGVHVRQAGPARTIAIRKYNGSYIEVDLVPVIACALRLPIRSGRPENNLEAFLVPKPHPSTERTIPYCVYQEANRLWRSYFPQAEEDLLYNVGCAKSVIKLLKLLRDKEQWSILASYYLKTVVMWMIIENPGISDYWREDNKYERFLEALLKLAGYVGQKKIPFLFDPKCNLIERISHQEASNIFNRLLFIIRNINRDSNSLRSIF